MSPYLVMLAQTIWHWVLAPPVHWVAALSTEWKVELAAGLILVLFYGRILECYVIGREQSAEWFQEGSERAEWRRYARMPESHFRSRQAARGIRAERHDRLAERLKNRGGGRLTRSILDRAANRRLEKAHRCREEIRRRAELWDAIQKARNNRRERVLSLMERLGSNDPRAAASALKQLNDIAGSFVWESLAPVGISESQRQRLISLLRLMAGTTSVGEACNALRSARQILEQNHCDWQWEAA